MPGWSGAGRAQGACVRRGLAWGRARLPLPRFPIGFALGEYSLHPRVPLSFRHPKLVFKLCGSRDMWQRFSQSGKGRSTSTPAHLPTSCWSPPRRDSAPAPTEVQSPATPQAPCGGPSTLPPRTPMVLLGVRRLPLVPSPKYLPRASSGVHSASLRSTQNRARSQGDLSGDGALGDEGINSFLKFKFWVWTWGDKWQKDNFSMYPQRAYVICVK